MPSVDIQHTLAFMLTSIPTALSPPPLHTARRWARPFSAREMQPHTFSASLSAQDLKYLSRTPLVRMRPDYAAQP
jgi:hypothetical protein